MGSCKLYHLKPVKVQQKKVSKKIKAMDLDPLPLLMKIIIW